MLLRLLDPTSLVPCRTKVLVHTSFSSLLTLFPRDPWAGQPGNQGQGSTGEFTWKNYFSYADTTPLAEKLRPISSYQLDLMTLRLFSNLDDSISLVARSQHFLPDFRYLKCFEDVCVFCGHALLMYSRVENKIYWNTVALSSIRGEILTTTNLISV